MNKIYLVKETNTYVSFYYLHTEYTSFDFGIMTIVYYPKISTAGDDVMST
jgi:hypothetical protein